MTTMGREHEGRVRWLGVRPARHAAMIVVQSVEARPHSGLVGDYAASSARARQVTLFQAEHLYVLGQLFHSLDDPDPALLRRNIVVSGINLLALIGQQFQIGEAVLSARGTCEPCLKMDHCFGRGAAEAMTGHGGITASVLRGGRITIGDGVTRLPVSGVRAAVGTARAPVELGDELSRSG